MNPAPTIKERPILFSGPMVRAIREGRKTQTRRIVKLPKSLRDEVIWFRNLESYPDGSLRAVFDSDDCEPFSVACPYGRPGDRLWVKETWAKHPIYSHPIFRADGPEAERALKEHGWPWKPSIHMPRRVSRITPDVTGVRVERLQEISAADAIAEGCKVIRDNCHVFEDTDYDKAGLCHSSPVTAYSILWDRINGPGSWEQNPLVWVVEFPATKSKTPPELTPADQVHAAGVSHGGRVGG